jgi:hypothetical protein
MTVIGHDDAWTNPEHIACKRATPDFSSSDSEGDEELFNNNNSKKQKTDSDLLILYEEELLFNSDHIVPVEPALLQTTLENSLENTLESTLDYLDGLTDNTWSASLLDSDRSALATLQFSFVDDGFQFEGGFL